MAGPGGAETDAGGARRLTGRAEWGWYVLAALSYTGFGVFHKFLLNWFVGPLWLVAVVIIGPAVVDRARRRGATGP